MKKLLIGIVLLLASAFTLPPYQLICSAQNEYCSFRLPKARGVGEIHYEIVGLRKGMVFDAKTRYLYVYVRQDNVKLGDYYLEYIVSDETLDRISRDFILRVQ